jgi:DNA-binding NarL/FixJ family response regulator
MGEKLNRRQALQIIQLDYDGKLQDDSEVIELTVETASKGLRKALLEKEKRYVHSIIDFDMKAIDVIFYENKDETENSFTIRRILQSYHYFKGLAGRGSQVAASVVVDIDQAIKFADFTAKEEKIIRMWMQGYTQTEIAEAVYDYQPNVNKLKKKCIDSIQHILVNLNPFN